MHAARFPRVHWQGKNMNRYQPVSMPIGCAVAGLLSVFTAGLAAQSGDRLQDREVKQIIEDVDRARDRFEDQLDAKVKLAVLRGSAGEVNVERYLDDLQSNVKNLKDRFTADYAASKEAETVLRQGSEIQTYFKSQPGEFKGRSEWDALASAMGRLASAYSTAFPLQPDAPVRRINDGEVASTAEALARNADELKKQIDKEQGLPPPVRSSAKKDVDLLIKQAKAVKSRASDAKPATAEAKTLFASVHKVGAFVGGQPSLLPGTMSAWGALRAPLDLLEQAFGLRPPTRQPRP
jgi:hypothetical protein